MNILYLELFFSVFYVYICVFVEFIWFVQRWKLAESKPLFLFCFLALLGRGEAAEIKIHTSTGPMAK